MVPTINTQVAFRCSAILFFFSCRDYHRDTQAKLRASCSVPPDRVIANTKAFPNNLLRPRFLLLQILGEYGKEVLYLKNRMGFVKLALRNRTPLVPTYVFGATDTFHTSTFMQKTRLGIVKRLRWAATR